GKIVRGKNVDERFYDLRYQRYNEGFGFQWGVLLSALTYTWQDKSLPGHYITTLKKYFELAYQAGDHIYARAAARLLNRGANPHVPARNFLHNHWTKATDLFDLLKPKEKWLQALDQLIALDVKVVDDTTVSVEKPVRMSWFVRDDEFGHKLEAREQKKGKKAWTKGRVVALTHLFERPEEYDYLTPADQTILQSINKEVEHSYYGYGKDSYSLTGYSALRACVNHPHVFMSDNITQPIEIVIGDPELLITESGKGFKVFMPGIPDDIDDFENTYSFEHETGNRYRLVQFNQKHRQIAQIVGEKGISIPKTAKDKVIQSLKAVAPLLNIQSDIAGIGEVDTGIEQVEADSKLYLNIQPSGGGLLMECHVQPLGEKGPILIPGSGNSMVVAQIDGNRLATHRDLDLEKQQFDQLQAICPVFHYIDNHQLLLDDLEEALNCLEQLEVIHASDEIPNIVLQWPKGQAVKLTQTASHSQMKMTIGKHKDWFALQGELSINGEEVIELKNLLKLLANSSGRFIPLADNKFLALTEQLRKQLDDIAGITVDGKFHALAAPVIDEVMQGMKVKTNKAWQQQLKRLRVSFELQPELPATLMANLRDYQKDGYD
ncbi:MAG: hypothetical protein HRT35_38540, partial [Algicola sp.]|nr:hypothetical protein [Algicola sp.]